MRKLAVTLVLLALAVLGWSTVGADEGMNCSERLYVEHGIGGLDYFVEGEVYVVTINDGEWAFEYHYFYSEEHVRWEYELYKYRLACQGNLDFDYGAEECSTTLINQSWTEEVYNSGEIEDSGEIIQENDDGSTTIIIWHVVARFEEYWIIEYSITGRDTTCYHREQIGAPPTYSFIGILNGIPGTQVFLGDTDNPNDDQTGYQCSLSSSVNAPDIGASWNTMGQLDNEGNCWMGMMTLSGADAGKVTPNIWGRGMVRVVVIENGVERNLRFNIEPGFTYLVILAYTSDDQLIGARVNVIPLGSSQPRDIFNISVG